MITITDYNLAVRFARTYFRGFKGLHTPMEAWPHWSDEAKARHNAKRDADMANTLARINKAIATMPDTWIAARLVNLKGKAKHVSITGCLCSRCGAALSAPDSVAAGIGPECQLKG